MKKLQILDRIRHGAQATASLLNKVAKNMKTALGHLLTGGVLACLLIAVKTVAQTAIDEQSPWPRVRTHSGHTVTLHQPQVENWTSNSFTARAAVGLKMAGAKKDLFGVVWIAAHGSVDRSNRIFTLDHLEITRARFPEAPDDGSNALAIVRAVIPAAACSVSLDYLVTALGFAQAAARQGPCGLKHDPPEIIWATNRTVLITIHGEPVLKPVAGGSLERVVNTPVLLVRNEADGRFYLNGGGQWFTAGSLQGTWFLAQAPPAEVTALGPAEETPGDGPKPRIIVRTKPAELLVTGGLPDFRPIRGTALQYAADTDSQLFFHTDKGEAYLLLSGRWFKAKSLAGPWTYVAPSNLPRDFAKIPPGTPQAVVLAAVPGTRQAELAVLANSVPSTATVNRRNAELALSYDGEPKFRPIDGTPLRYALNASLPVILVGSNYYALDNGVWFTATGATGPWNVATAVPEEIYTVPPSSPLYYATFASVLQSSDDEVEVAYTPGYQGAYEQDGTVVYGTGWDYEPWYGDEYYDWGWTWGYSYWYVPWYQCWVWRDWWDQPGGLRSALIENIYNRWSDRVGVTPHDLPPSGIYRSSTQDAFKPSTDNAFKPSTDNAFKPSTDNAFKPSTDNAFKSSTSDAFRTPASRVFKPTDTHKGHPAAYGRFQGATRPAALSPPPSTVALNPYSRPQTAVRRGEVPRGAQLLTTVRQAPGGGRDLYASPDGGVYQRKPDGWYRREAGGQWRYAAPINGTMEHNQVAAARRTPQPGVGGGVPRPQAGMGAPARAARVPDTGFEARAQDIAALEREYYARSLAQLRAQNPGGGGGRRAVRPGARRR